MPQTHPCHPPSPPVAFDTTLTCPLLPSYLPSATTDSVAIFLAKALHKIAKHAAGLDALDTDFLPLVLTTLGGVGPPTLVDFVRAVYSALAVGSIHAGATGHDAAHAYANLQQLLGATVARNNAYTIDRHTAD